MAKNNLSGILSMKENLRLRKLIKDRNLATKIIDTILDGNGNSINVRTNPLGAIAWIYEMNYSKRLPSIGNDRYNIPGTKLEPGYIDSGLFSGILEDNSFRELAHYEDFDTGDLITIQTIPDRHDYGCFDILNAGIYTGRMIMNNLEAFSQGTDGRFKKMEWNWWDITSQKGINISFWRKK